LLVPPRKKSQPDPPPRLDTPEQIHHSEARDRALITRAQREQEETAANRAQFELIRDKIVFAVELLVAIALATAALVASLRDPELIPLLLLSGGGVGGVAAFVRRRASEQGP